MQRSVSADHAACGLAVLIFALAWPPREPSPKPCAQPVLRASGEVHCAADSEEVPRLEGPLRRLFGQPIDPNRASAETLETLPGIGAARAAAIARERCRRPFTGVDELTRVPGLGPKRVAAIEPFLGIERGLAPAGLAPVKSSTCASYCKNAGKSAPKGSACPPAQSAEASQ